MIDLNDVLDWLQRQQSQDDRLRPNHYRLVRVDPVTSRVDTVQEFVPPEFGTNEKMDHLAGDIGHTARREAGGRASPTEFKLIGMAGERQVSTFTLIVPPQLDGTQPIIPETKAATQMMGGFAVQLLSRLQHSYEVIERISTNRVAALVEDNRELRRHARKVAQREREINLQDRRMQLEEEQSRATWKREEKWLDVRDGIADQLMGEVVKMFPTLLERIKNRLGNGKEPTEEEVREVTSAEVEKIVPDVVEQLYAKLKAAELEEPDDEEGERDGAH